MVYFMVYKSGVGTGKASPCIDSNGNINHGTATCITGVTAPDSLNRLCKN